MTHVHDPRDIADDHHTPRYEPWLGVSVASFLPLIALFVLPSGFAIPMLAAAGLILAIGAIMLVRQERQKSEPPTGDDGRDISARAGARPPAERSTA
jgi:hypothetical protein